MCTLIHEEETKAKKAKLKSTNNVGWKIVSVTGRRYFAPMQKLYQYSLGKNVDTKSVLRYSWRGRPEVTAGVFHLFNTRKIGREIINAMNCYDYYKAKTLKLVKVLYDKEDFYCTGEG